MNTDRRHVLVLGGARSGKSVFSENLALSLSSQCIYIATAQIWDAEMRSRVDLHQERRDENWHSVEEALSLVDALNRESRHGLPILVDCLTLWVTNLMMAERDISVEGDLLVSTLPDISVPIIFVSNEVGQGIVPDNQMAREFRDHAGLLHQKIAQAADEVYFITAGLPQKLKG